MGLKIDRCWLNAFSELCNLKCRAEAREVLTTPSSNSKGVASDIEDEGEAVEFGSGLSSSDWSSGLKNSRSHFSWIADMDEVGCAPLTELCVRAIENFWVIRNFWRERYDKILSVPRSATVIGGTSSGLPKISKTRRRFIFAYSRGMIWIWLLLRCSRFNVFNNDRHTGATAIKFELKSRISKFTSLVISWGISPIEFPG